MSKLCSFLIFGIISLPFLVDAQYKVIQFHSEYEQNVFQHEKPDVISLLLAADSDSDTFDYQIATSKLTQHIQFLESKRNRYKRSIDFWEFVFFSTHKKFLKSYQSFPTFRKTMLTGHYDCVTGTALLSWVYTALGVQIAIKETNYHIYLMIEADEPVMIESTDPLSGFVTQEQEIYNRTLEAIKGNDNDPIFTAFRCETIDSVALAAMQYYNQGVALLNDQYFEKALQAFQKSLLLYPNERVQFIRNMALEYVAQQEETVSLKQD